MSLTGFPGQSADARRRLAGRLRAGALRRHRRARRALRPRAHRPRTGGRRVQPGRHVLAARRLARHLRGVGPAAASRWATAISAPLRTTATARSDGWVVIAVASNKLFRALADRHRPARAGSRTRASAASPGASSAATRSTASSGRGWRSARSTRWCDALGPDGAGVPCSPVYTVDQLLAASAAAGARDDPAPAARDARARCRARRGGEAVRHPRRGAPSRSRDRRAHDGASTASCSGSPTRSIAGLRARQVI